MQCFMLTRAIIGSVCVTKKTIRVNIHVSDNRKQCLKPKIVCYLLKHAVLRVDVSDDRKWLCDEISYLRACSRER